MKDLQHRSKAQSLILIVSVIALVIIVGVVFAIIQLKSSEDANKQANQTQAQTQQKTDETKGEVTMETLNQRSSDIDTSLKKEAQQREQAKKTLSDSNRVKLEQ
ncbi:TPA: hypothetical protein DDX46_01155 [Candidatus Saccharibacteria bacterium]|nr:MAG: hypothetical protein UW38_C0001G0047 [Candidatus Saccharibacteria bacterium GW2011_GWC2_44_17]OGL23275.1 MAG: hypothetical protein A2791_00250 [Candidatus Saccharibacteria bacterium RIFCSPHIGHO2_01_FULL_46_30]OGL33113.1 MAG: hypothetical protein A3E20_02195 [Candidatus Saccharibacteria bacterium RIFCSPHIGHO2_12_FULL_47_16]HBH77337.1 hypothetical protein [Candidatus Saccharibacteria bacterium]